MPVIETPPSTEPFLVIHASRFKAVRSIILALVFLLVSISMWFIQSGNGLIGQTAHIIGTYAGPPFFALMLIWSVKHLFSKKPLLVFDDRGITTRIYGLMPWSEIAEVRLGRAMNRRYFAIIAGDIESLATRYPTAQGNNLRFNQENMGMAYGIGEASLPMKVEQLLAEVGDYCERNTHIYRRMPPHLRTMVERALNTPPPTDTKPIRRESLDPRQYTISAQALQEKRDKIEKYVASNTDAHHLFDLEDGTWYEGYILEVNEETILFEWFYSPIIDNADEEPFEIPIAAIDVASLR